MGDEGAKAMSEMLKVNTTLTSLDLSGEEESMLEEERSDHLLTGFRIGDEGMKMIRESWGARGGELQLKFCLS